jgi:hypothetical protein
MPKFDGTGPMGMGPRTGRGFGPCGEELENVEKEKKELGKEK